MAEQAREQITIEASISECFTTLVDFESYPEWVGDLKAATVRESDDQGRGLEVEFRAAGMGRSTTYTLRYDYTDAPSRLGWTLAEGDIQRSIDGHYELVELGADPVRTEVVYELSIDLIMPIPGFIKKRAEDRIIRSALAALKERIESGGR